MEEHALASPSEGLADAAKRCVAGKADEGRDENGDELTMGVSGRTCRPRWKPTQAQMTILEGFFSAGHVKATPELLVAVQAAGEATETQVSVWMKNRMARAKKKTARRGQNAMREMGVGEVRRINDPLTSGTGRRKRLRDSEIAAPLQVREGEVYARAYAVCEQVCDVVGSVADEDVCQLMRLIHGARRVFCYGVGREGLVVRSFAMRLYHLGKQVSVVGDMNCPPVAAGDLLVVSAGPGYFSTVVALTEQARRNGGHILLLTASSNQIDWADTVVRLGAAQTLPPDVHHSGGSHLGMRNSVESSFQVECPEIDSPLMMGSSYEISLWVLLDCVVSLLQQQWGVQSIDMVQRHTNLE